MPSSLRSSRRILDLGTGDGRLLALVKLARPETQGIGRDISPTMLEKARLRFAENKDISVLEHDLNDSLPNIGTFDGIVSSFLSIMSRETADSHYSRW